MSEITPILNDIFYIDEKIEEIVEIKKREIHELQTLKTQLNTVYKKIKVLKGDFLKKTGVKKMNTYRNIKYYRTWIRGNWYLILPDFEISIQLVDGCSTDEIEKIINKEVWQYI